MVTVTTAPEKIKAIVDALTREGFTDIDVKEKDDAERGLRILSAHASFGGVPFECSVAADEKTTQMVWDSILDHVPSVCRAPR